MLKQAIFASGCFWCTEAVFKRLRGVKSVTSGYAGGSVDNPSYEQVSGGNTGHAEAVRVEYDPDEVSYETLLDVFFGTHDPTTLNRQGADVGPQYRSAIFFFDDEQKALAEGYMEKLKNEEVFDKPIVTTLEKSAGFYEAEDYHKDYYEKNPAQAYCQAVISPKIAKLRAKYAKLLKDR